MICEEDIDKNAPACNLQVGAFTCGYFFRALKYSMAPSM